MATIGVLTTSYPHEGDPVAGIFVRGMARALAARGHRLEVLAPLPREGRALEDPGVRVRSIRYAPRALRRTFFGAGVPDNVRRDVRAWPGLATFPGALYTCARELAPRWDALLSHWALPCALVAGLLRGERPHLAVLHSADVHLVRRLPLRAELAGRVGAGATDLLFASAALREQFLSLLPAVRRGDLAGRCHASAMGIEGLAEVGARGPLRSQLGLHGFTALALGRLVPIKGLHHAIDATAELGISLLVVGDGPERAALERHAAVRRADVRFLGVRTGDEKARLLAAADAFVAPSLELGSGRTEGTPTAVLEAALAGLPIVASPTGGIVEILSHDRSALLVPPVQMAASLRRLRDDAALGLSLGAAAREVGRGYLWPALAPRIEALLVPGGSS